MKECKPADLRPTWLHVRFDCIIEPRAAQKLAELGINTGRHAPQDYSPRNDEPAWFYIPPCFANQFEYKATRYYAWLSLKE